MDEAGRVTDDNLPAGVAGVVDLAPVTGEEGPAWLVLDADGLISRWDPATGRCASLAATSVPDEPGHRPWDGHELRWRLHGSRSGRFAAVVNDYGRFGEVIDLRSGRVTMTLDNGGSHEDTVPFSLAFARHQGRDVVVHRTDWNRLDVCDPGTGELLTGRGPTRCRPGESPPGHYLDYFHGALYLSPDGTRIYDDGWFWPPLGIPVAWEMPSWLDGNRWESEDGPTRIEFCLLEHWDRAFTWIGSQYVAIEDVGDDDTPARVRIFDVTKAATRRPGNTPIAAEIATLPGPAGRLFSDGRTLVSSRGKGLFRWDPRTGTRTGSIPGFVPAYYHPATRDLLEVGDRGVRRCRFP